MASSGVFKAGYVINNRFEIKRLLGQGGFAMVFEGTDRNLDRQVAIKILHGAVLANSSEDHRVIERFEREAKLAASVDHPSVVNIYDAGEINGLGEPFIVMEYLKGVSLQEHLDEHGPMAAKQLIPLFKDVLMGLGYAHELGIVHKDLKPDNIFYRYPGSMRESLCIVDFGIAHIGRSNSGRVTRDGEFFGTPSYMPPEYISEQKVSAAFDVYQMGLILIECLTGQAVVHHEDAVATLLMHLNRQFRVPPALLESEGWPVIERAIAADPALRYKDALAFAEALATVPANAWPERERLTMVPIKGSGSMTDLPTMMGELGDTATEVEEELVAEDWTTETSYRTKTNPGATVEGSLNALDDAIAHTAAAKRVTAREVASTTPVLPFDQTEEVSVQQAMSTPSSSQRPLIALGVVAAAVVVALVVVFAIWSGDQPRDGVASAAPDMGSAVAVIATPDMSGAEVNAQPDAAMAVAKVEPEQVEVPVPAAPATPPVLVMVSGEPEVVLVRDAQGVLLGETPMTIEFASAEVEERTLSLSQAGYEGRELVVSPEQSEKGAHYKLRRQRRSAPVVKKAPDKQAGATGEQKTPGEKANPKVELLGGKNNGGGQSNGGSTGILLPQ